MNKPLFRRGLSLMLALGLTASLGITARAAETDGLCPHHPTHTADCGHSDEQPCTFECLLCSTVELKGTDVSLTDGTEYTYTGQEIKPHVTVMVDRTVLVENEHYTVAYANNIGVGTGTVAVTGIEEAGYTGTIILPFTIVRPADMPQFQLVEIKGTDVVMEGSEFTYSGQPIEPKVTVTVNGTLLTEGRDYTVTYINNLAPGTGTLTVQGIATASETLGYYGKVSMDFTIVKAEEPTEPEKPTEPETPSTPDEEDKEEAKPFDYKITKGSGSKWNQESKKNLSFTVNADTDDITAIRIDGRKLSSNYYTLGSNGVVILKNSWLEQQDIGTYRITIQFEDGDAEGKFTITAPADSSNPKTGDTIGLWIGMLVCSGAGAVALIFLGRKKIFR